MSQSLCTYFNHEVIDASELIKTDSINFFCKNCLRFSQLDKKYGKKVFFFSFPKSKDKKLLTFLENNENRVLLGQFSEFLHSRGNLKIEISNIEILETKHKPLKITASYKNEKTNEVTKNQFYLKFLKDDQAEIELLTQNFLTILKTPHIPVNLFKWIPEKNIYISEHYPDTIELFELSESLLSDPDRILLQKEFSKILAVWYIFGKTDFFHNQLLSTFQNKPCLVQMDHENKGYPLSDLTHPFGLDYDNIERNQTNLIHMKIVITTLKKLNLGFRKSKNEFPDENIKKDFLLSLTIIVQRIQQESELKDVLIEKLNISSAYMFHRMLIDIVNDNENHNVLLNILGKEIESLHSIEETKEIILNGWKNYTNKSLMKKFGSSKKQSEEKKQEKKYLREKLTFNTEYKHIKKNLVELKSILNEMNYNEEKINTLISDFELQLTLSKKIWLKIMTTEIILKLAENNIFRK